MDFLPFVAFGSGVGFEHAESIFKESGLGKSLSFEPDADEHEQSLTDLQTVQRLSNDVEAICTFHRSVVHFPKRGEKPDDSKDNKSSGTSTDEENEETEGLDRERLNPLG